MTLAQAIREVARVHPEKTALIDARDGRTLSYGDFVERSARIATWLAAQGVGAGDRVALLAHNAPRTFELLVACSQLGAIFAPMNVRLSDRELEAVLAIAEPKVVLVDDEQAKRQEGVRFESEALVDLPPRSGVAGDVGAPLVLLFTSGTTGKPKGALITETNIAANAASTRRAWNLGHADVTLVDAPTFHAGGLNVLATPLLTCGGTVVVAARFDPKLPREAWGCTVAFGVPTMLERLLAEGIVDRSKTRLWVTGGAPCPGSLIDAFAARRARLVQGFGMTECGPNCFRPLATSDARTVGVPTFDLDARLVGPDGAAVKDGEAGELLLRGPHVFAGYFRDEAATRAAFTDDGWLRTGDVLRATREGFVVVGRTKEMFISGGENVYPAEVERAILEHEALAEAAVVAVADERWGESGVAFVVTRDGSPAPSAEALRAFVRARLAGYKVPRELVFEPALPRTATGKIDKRALADRVARR
jgi:fatty-acyl-CoA synthase